MEILFQLMRNENCERSALLFFWITAKIKRTLTTSFGGSLALEAFKSAEYLATEMAGSKSKPIP
jgi:hypothetical protein